MKKIIISFILIVLVVFFMIFIVVFNNNRYEDGLYEEIKDNYVDKDIKYLNKYGLYYIIIADDELIVLDNEYQEIFKDDISKIKKIDKEASIVYRLNSAMYEVKIVSKDKIIYEYYDLYTNELVDELEIGG